MADTTLTAVPTSFYQGDTLELLITVADFSAADGWSLSYEFKNKDGGFSFDSTASGSDHLVTVAATATADWLPGQYFGICKATKASTIKTVWRGNLEILPDLSAAGDAYDTRSHAKKCLDAINLVLEGKATRDVLQTTIAGQSISRMGVTELLTFRAHYQNLVDNEIAAQNAENGISNSRNILVRFSNAS